MVDQSPSYSWTRVFSKVNHSQNLHISVLSYSGIHKHHSFVERSFNLMAPKRSKSQNLSQDPNGMFAGMVVFLVEKGVQPRRLQVLLHFVFFLCNFVFQTNLKKIVIWVLVLW